MSLIVITLALGIGANASMFSILNSFLWRPLPVKEPQQLVVVAEHLGNEEPHNVSYLDYRDYRTRNDIFTDMAAYTFGFVGLSVSGQAERVMVTYATGNYFSMLGIHGAQGRVILPMEGERPGGDPVLVLGHRYWKRRFGGDPSIVGKKALVNGEPFTIVGVVPRSFRGTYSVAEFDAYLPLEMATVDPLYRSALTKRDSYDMHVLARLKPGVTLERAQAALSVMAKQLEHQYPDTNRSVGVRVIPENLARPEPSSASRIPFVAAAFMLMGGLVLIVACVNVVNLLLVRATMRQKELALRAALGASRARLVRVVVSESVLLSVAGAIAGLLLGRAVSAWLESIRLPGDLPFVFDLSFDWRVFGYVTALALIAGLLVGLPPAVRSSRADLNEVLREGGRGSAGAGRRGSRIRKALVVAQIAVSLVLLIAAGLFVRSVGNARAMDLGFDPRHVLNLSMDVAQQGYDERRGRAFYRDVIARVTGLPGVASVSFAYSVPFGYYSSGQHVNVEGQPSASEKDRPVAGYNFVDPAYFRTMRIPILRGRAFTEQDDERARPIAVINEYMASHVWPDRDAIGRRFSMKGPNGPWIEVVGIAKNGKYNSIFEGPTMYFFAPLAQNYSSLRALHVRTAVPPDTLALPVQRQIQALDPSLPVYDIMTMEAGLQSPNGFFLLQMGAMLAGALGVFGLLLASVGVYGVVSYAASQRTHEIGIRMALGAQARDVLRLVIAQGVTLIIMGVAGGLAIAAVLSRFLASVLFGVSPNDPVTFASAPVLLGLVALVACLLPVRRAIRIDPIAALRHP